MDEQLAQLVRRAQRGDGGAFASLIRRCERPALAIAYAHLRDADRAGEVVQEAFIRSWRKLGDLEDPARFVPWLCGIVRNLAIDCRRRINLRGDNGQRLNSRSLNLGERGAKLDQCLDLTRISLQSL